MGITHATELQKESSDLEPNCKWDVNFRVIKNKIRHKYIYL
jgi:hypothetical protein